MLFDKASSYYDRGAAHVLRQVHKFISDKNFMCKVFKGSFRDPEFWGGANFIPFTVEELKDIAAFDAQTRNSWTPPPPAKLTFF